MSVPAPAATLTHLRIVGLMYVATTLIGVVNTFAIKSGVYDVNTFLETVRQFRVAQVFDLVMYSLIIVLGWASYLATKAARPHLALFALMFRYGEALLGFVALIIVLMVAVILQGSAESAAFSEQQLGALAVMFMNLSNAVWDILFVLMGIGALIFIYLFRVCRAIPRWLTLWGMFTYISMILFGAIKLIDPALGAKIMFVMYPGALFELTIGLWLIFMGSKTASVHIATQASGA
jgi:hypothetical protein